MNYHYRLPALLKTSGVKKKLNALIYYFVILFALVFVIIEEVRKIENSSIMMFVPKHEYNHPQTDWDSDSKIRERCNKL